ncbi:MAG: HesA/MoeB/ThiF family protein [Succinivibrionaceae bacterium]
MELTEEQNNRYYRNILLKEIGVQGQKKLLNSRVLVIGVGGLGSPVALYLAAAGVGTIGIVDEDVVDISNLQRQIMYTSADLGRSKAEVAGEHIKALNPDINVMAYKLHISSDNIPNLIRDYDFILDCTDNFSAKFLINDACVLGEKPFSHAGILRFKGQLMTYVPHQGPCYRCVFGDIPPKDAVANSRQSGVVGALAGVIGSLQAMEAIKYLTDSGNLLTGYLLTYDALTQDFRKIKLPSDTSSCKVCGDHPVITHLADYNQSDTLNG